MQKFKLLGIVAVGVAMLMNWGYPAIAQQINSPPDCSNAAASPSTLWPPDHTMRSNNVIGVTDPDNDLRSIQLTKITSDEAMATSTGDPSPDMAILAPNAAELRAERLGTGDGRVYHMFFIASDAQGNRCAGDVTVSVPLNLPTAAVDSGIMACIGGGC